jgi:hypothetical protein
VTATPGYSGKPLVSKLGIKPGQRVSIVGAPAGFRLAGLPEGVALTGARSAELDLILLFVPDRALLRKEFLRHAKRLKQAGQLWVAWPKKASKVATDLTEDGVREICLPTGFVDVKVCAVDDTWSGLKLVRRLSQRSKA